MIEKISLKNFKLFKEETDFIGLNKVNLLTGINGRGKSSFLQSLLLMKQTLLIASGLQRLFLNGQYVNLGNALDVKNAEISREYPVVFSYSMDGKKLTISYHVDETDDQILMSDLVTRDAMNFGFNRIQYVSAERIGPRLSYEKSPQGLLIGAKGEYAVDVLSKAAKAGMVISDIMRNNVARLFDVDSEEIETGVLEHVDFWMTKMYGDTSVDIVPINDANVDVMKIGTQHVRGSKPTNVGFGFSYAFPILVAGMVARPGDILIIENPEAHLHPSAQSMIAKFLTLVAENDAQVFVETHSEHILNACRVLAKQKIVSNEDINVMFFDDAYESFYKTIPVDQNGKMPEWPNGFFDQAEKDLNILLDL